MNNEAKRQLDKYDISLYNYNIIKKNVDDYFLKYRNFKMKADIVRKKLNCSLSADNLGIFSSNVNDPTGNKVEQLERISKFIDATDKVIDYLIKNEFSQEEKVYFKKGILKDGTDEQIAELLNYHRNSIGKFKKSCYIKLSLWLDLEVYDEKKLKSHKTQERNGAMMK